MKIRILILIAVAALLFLAAVALAYSGGEFDTSYAVESGPASGGDYQMIGLGWQAIGTISGDGYQLLDTASVNASPPPSAQAGCCCNYLPCLLRD